MTRAETIDANYLITDSSASFENIKTQKFEKLTKYTFGFGFEDKSIWLRYTVPSNINQLVYNYPFFKEIKIITENGETLHTIDKYQEADKKRHFALTVPSSKLIYLKLTPAHHSLVIDFSEIKSENFIDYQYTKAIYTALILGALIIIWFYNLLILLKIKEIIYLFYLYYLGAFIVGAFYLSGFALDYINYSSNIEILFTIASIAAIHGIVLFTREFLSTKTTTKFIDKILLVTQYLLMLLMVATAFLPLGYGFKILTYIIFSVGVLCIVAASIRIKQSDDLAKYYLLGWAFYFVGIMAMASRSAGWLPATIFTNHSMLIGSVVEACIFSFALINRTKRLQDNFLGTISHELRTPIALIIGTTQTIKDAELSEKNKERLTRIRNASYELENLADELTDYNRLYKGGMVTIFDNFDCDQVLLDIARVFEVHAIKKGLRFNINIQTGIIKSDSKRIKQLVNNLLSNALKYTKEGEINFYANLDASILIIKIIDTGIGISKWHQKEIFEPFTRLNIESNEVGMGMGLSIVKKIIDALKGRIIVQSKKNLGTTFEIQIPVILIKRLKNILIIDDNDEIRQMMNDMLNTIDTTVKITEASTGNEGLKKALEFAYDIIFLDINLPDMSGKDVAKTLKSKNHKAKIIWISATVPTKRDGIFDEYLRKPITLEALQKII